MQENEFPREVSLVLSGGAAKGAYHLGIIDVLQKKGVVIKAISGTSIGAIIGAAVASGKKADEIFTIITSKEYKRVFKVYLKKGALFRIDMQAPILKKLIPYDTFEELQIPLTVCLTDICAVEAYYVSSGNLRDMVLASSSISPLLPPVKIDGTLYSDGGLVDNFPVEKLKKFSYPIVGVNLYANNRQVPTTILGWLRKNIRVAWQHKNYEKATMCNYYFSNVLLDNISAYSFSGIEKAYRIGQKDMEQFLASKHII